MNYCKFSLVLFLVAMIAGCETIPNQRPVAAIIPVHTKESMAELRKIIEKALHGIPVTIAKTAFNKSNALNIERKKPIGPDGRVIRNRIDEAPITFKLFVTGDRCILKDMRTGNVFQLMQAKCSTTST